MPRNGREIRPSDSCFFRRFVQNKSMNTVSIEIPEAAFTFLKKNQADVGRELLTAAVVKWFEIGTVSQGKAAEILGLSRAEFLALLTAYRVSAWQYTKEDLAEELSLD